MKKIIFLLISSIFFLNLGEAGTIAYRRAAGSDPMFTGRSNKPSRWCNVMRASTCANPAGFRKYWDQGCVNDLDSESKCLQTFCGTNCAALRGCPQDPGVLTTMCRTHCTKVDLGNEAAQKRLNKCVPGSYTPAEAAAKAGRRDYYRKEQKELARGQRRGAEEARQILDLIKSLVAERTALFSINGTNVRVADFLPNLKRAMKLTQQMHKAMEVLINSGQPPEVIEEAKELVGRNKSLLQFVNDSDELHTGAQELMNMIQNEARPQQARPLSARPDSVVSDTDSVGSRDSFVSDEGISMSPPPEEGVQSFRPIPRPRPTPTPRKRP